MRQKVYKKKLRPSPLKNANTKVISKGFAEKLKEALLSIISENQTAYVKNRCISESIRLIADIIGVCNKQNIPGYLVTMDIVKAFDSLDHDFLIYVLTKSGFRNNFIKWVKVLSNNQESCVVNRGYTVL